ncbi:hypothetical protein Droror1_Dr00013222 [Drosera rotundifolia]
MRSYGVGREAAAACHRRLVEALRWPMTKSPASPTAVVVLLGFLFFGLFCSLRLIDFNPAVGTPMRQTILMANWTIDSDIDPHEPAIIPTKPRRRIEYVLNCSDGNVSQSCLTYYPTESELDPNAPPPRTCPDYFRWIYEDLKPWSDTGITREIVEGARKTANFRLVVVDGRAYVEWYEKSFQTRDVFTLWGITQLLRKYPGKVPDLELMFDCVDWPVIVSRDYHERNATPPPLFRYCGDDRTLDIVFPDWSFWGWPEINIKPWESLLEELKYSNRRMRWVDRKPYAYWKGNPAVAETRMDLLKCNVSDSHDWDARIYGQDWIGESQHGYNQSNLANQCSHRYKIYIEGSAWSVSEKYILACDSVTLYVKPRYYDFFSRGLMPVYHYWPVSDNDKCRSIKFAVQWGNRHKQKAQKIGRAASKFIQEDLKMDLVYDYMLHLLTEYSKLLKFKPQIPEDATELCSETMACPSDGMEKKFMMESMGKNPSENSPCALPPPYDKITLATLKRGKANSIWQVEKWEKEYWDARSKADAVS